MAAHGPEPPQHVTPQPHDSVSPAAGEEDRSLQGGYDTLLGEGRRGFLVHSCVGSLGSCSGVGASPPSFQAQLRAWEHLGPWDRGGKGNRLRTWARGRTLSISGGGSWKRQTSTPCILPPGMRPRHMPSPTSTTRPPRPQPTGLSGHQTGDTRLPFVAAAVWNRPQEETGQLGRSVTRSHSCNLACSPSSGRTPLRLLFPFRPCLELVN